MQQLTIQIPDNEMSFFLELAHDHGFIVDNSKHIDLLTPQQVREVNDERQKIKDDPTYLLDWKDARKTLKLD